MLLGAHRRNRGRGALIFAGKIRKGTIMTNKFIRDINSMVITNAKLMFEKIHGEKVSHFQ